MATKKKSSKKGLASASKTTKKKVARKGRQVIRKLKEEKKLIHDWKLKNLLSTFLFGSIVL